MTTNLNDFVERGNQNEPFSAQSQKDRDNNAEKPIEIEDNIFQKENLESQAQKS